MAGAVIISDALKEAGEHMGMFTRELKKAAESIYAAQLEKTTDGKHIVGENYEDIANHARDVVHKLEAFHHLVVVANEGKPYNRAFKAFNRLQNVNMLNVLEDAAKVVETIEEMMGGPLQYLTYPDPHSSRADTHLASETIKDVMMPAVGNGVDIVQQLLAHATKASTHYIPLAPSSGYIGF